MNTIAEIERPGPAPNVLAGISRITHPPKYFPKVSPGVIRFAASNGQLVLMSISIPDFNFVIEAVVELNQNKAAGRIFIRSAIDKNVELNVTFTGRTTDDETSLEIESVSFRLAATQDCARADFVSSTLNAALNLSRGVHLQIPEISLDLVLSFDSPLLEVSRLLQERQTAYRLFSIELATGIDFGILPYTLSGEEAHTIRFAYHSIVDRTFIDGMLEAKVVIPATGEGLQFFRHWRESLSLEFPPEIVTKTLLDRPIFLGTQSVKIIDPYIENVDRVQEELARCDGHDVTLVIRSRTNRAQYSLPDAPRLPSNAWDSRTQSLIDLERELDSRLVQRYHALAAGSLAGLTEEERNRVTQRVELDEETFID